MDASENLIPGESIDFQSKKHWIAPVRDSLPAAGLLLIAYLVGLIRPDATDGVFGFLGNLLRLIQTGLVVVAIGWIAYNIAVWRTASFAVSNLRVLRSEGLVQRRSSETLLSSVTDVRLRVGMLGRQLGFGDLQILTGSGEGGADAFKSITNATEFRNAMMARKLGDQVAAKPSPAPAPATAAVQPSKPAPSTAETADGIRHLGELRDQGLITAAEFDAKKAELLARL